MNYSEIFITAITSLRSNVLRTALTMLGIIIGIFAVTMVLIVSQGATDAITSKVSALGTNLIYIPRGPSGKLTDEDAKAIFQQIPGLTSYDESVLKGENVSANGQTNGYTVAGTTPAGFNMISLTLQQGAYFTDDDVASYTPIAVIGSQVVTDLFGAGANPVGQYIQVGTKSFYVVGTLQEKGGGIAGNPDNTVYIPVTTAESVITGSTHLSAIDVEIQDENQADTVAKEIKQLLLDRYQITDPQIIPNILSIHQKIYLRSLVPLPRFLVAFCQVLQQ